MAEIQLKLFTADELPMRRYSKGIGLAGQWLEQLNDPADELYRWIEVRRKRYAANQIQFVDAIHDCYSPVFRWLPPKACKVFWELCGFYGKGANFLRLANLALVDSAACSSHLARLVEHGVILRQNRGKYVVPNRDLLRFFALRSDSRFRRWSTEGTQHDIIDRFIQQIEESVQ